MIFKKNLHQVLANILIIFAMMPICIISFYILYHNIDMYKNDFEKNIYKNLNNISLVLDNFDKNNKNTLEIFSSNLHIQNVLKINKDKDSLISTMYKYEKTYDEIKYIVIGSEDGGFYTTSENLLPKNFDPRKRPWYIQAIRNSEDISVSNIYESAIKKGDYDVTYSKKIIDYESGRVLGIVGLDIDFEVIKKAISDFKLNKSGFFMILNQYGQVVADNDPKMRKKILRDNDIIENILNHKNSSKQILIEGEKYIYYLVKNNSTKWHIIAFVPKMFFLQQIFIYGIITVLIIILMYGLSILLGNKLAKTITKPVRLFIEALDEVGKGNYDAKIHYPNWAPNEIHEVLKSINSMIDKVESQTNELNQKNKEISLQHEEINALYEETIAMNQSLNNLVHELKDTYKTTVKCLADAIEANDVYTKGHCERVTKYALQIADEMNISKKDMLNLQYASLLHDIGKIGIPNNILNKPDRLTDEEYEIIKKHPSIGYKIIKEIPYLSESAVILHEHHERIDGKGYPNGLTGDKINLMSKILSIADSYDAMTSNRPYRFKPLSKEEAIEQLIKNKDTQFDSQIVDIFIKLLKMDDI